VGTPESEGQRSTPHAANSSIACSVKGFGEKVSKLLSLYGARNCTDSDGSRQGAERPALFGRGEEPSVHLARYRVLDLLSVTCLTRYSMLCERC
jgi:hypothetical protein